MGYTPQMGWSGDKRGSVAEEVAEKLRGLILQGRYHPGQKLPPERALAQQLGVNRASLREALKQLEQLGLVRIRQGDGTRVLDVLQHAGLDLLGYLLPLGDGEAVLGDLLEFRQVIGREIARLAAQRATDDDVDELAQLAAQRPTTTAGVLLQDTEFYARLTRAARNVVFTLMLNTVRRVVSSFQAFFIDFNPPAALVWAHHTALLEALRARNAQAAHDIADEHLRRGKEHLLHKRAAATSAGEVVSPSWGVT